MPRHQLNLLCDCTPVYDTWYEFSEDLTPLTAIVNAVATAQNVEAEELAPLHHSIDTDGLNRLFRDREGASEAVLGFRVDGYNVFIREDGRIRVCDPADSSEPHPVFEPSDLAA